MFRHTVRALNREIIPLTSTALPPLPAVMSSPDVLKHMSAQQIDFHWDKHHRTYYNNLKTMLEGDKLNGLPLDQLVLEAKKSGNTKLFNNAAQALNHNFFWQAINPAGRFDPKKHSEIAAKFEKDLGSFDSAMADFANQATTHFGSGWAWIVLDKDGKMAVKAYHDADTPYAHGETPLMTIDVWEHAYYLDFQNRRAGFVDSYIKNLANWDLAEDLLRQRA
eukprot:TRINITY_DN53475_c0_g1_i1.p2 TRINITY_DN53475_c0_g1~~TRINITY_DN53475_c0_g1_i1.p2  ORF type:complete len:221 (+),score=26.83 TRINITY_DN53475_c0_g1_i1:15-677(+)